LKLAIRVDQLRAKPNRQGYAVTHEKLHRMIAEYARCPALAETLEKIRAVALTWMCTAHPAGTVRANRHEELAEGLVLHDPEIAEKVMRNHMSASRDRALLRLQPFFSMRRKHGRVFTRGERARSAAASAEAS
jgi:DNA-binding GntR family transcriptional regulator